MNLMGSNISYFFPIPVINKNTGINLNVFHEYVFMLFRTAQLALLRDHFPLGF